MAKRRNSKPKTVEAVAEVAEPVAGDEPAVVAAPAAAVADAVRVEAASEAPAATDVAPPAQPADTAPELIAAAPVNAAADESPAETAAATAQVTALEAPPADLAISESAAITTSEASLAADTSAEATSAAVALPQETPAAAPEETAVQTTPAELPTLESPAIAAAWRPADIAAEAATITVAEPAANIAETAVVTPTSEPISVAATPASSEGASAPEAAPAPTEAPASAVAPLPPTLVQAARTREFLGRAASVGLAAALGVVVGSLTTSALFPPAPVNAATAQPDVPRATVASVDRLTAEVAELKAALAASTAMAPPSKNTGSVDDLSRDIAVLKASFGESEVGANQRLLELVAQVNRTEKTATDLATRVAKLEKPAVAKANVSPEITGAVKPAATPVADGWVLWRVYQGRAVVQNEGHVFDIMPGAELPGLGVVREIAQRDGRWVVITENGMIVAAKGQRVG